MIPPTTATTHSNPMRARLTRRRVFPTRTSLSSQLRDTHALADVDASLFDAVRSEPANARISGEHTEGHVVVKDGKVGDDLFFVSQTAGNAHEIFLREEAVVKAHAAADAITR